jgi:spore coat polysaccharide biosynthesis protein SpsF (cytidylyltransferase family)
MTVNEGEAFVAGDDTDTAQKLLEAAEKAGLDPSVVRLAAGDGGFIVPEALAPRSKKSTTDKK